MQYFKPLLLILFLCPVLLLAQASDEDPYGGAGYGTSTDTSTTASNGDGSGSDNSDTSASSGISNTAKEAVDYWQNKYDLYLKGDDQLYQPAVAFRDALIAQQKQARESRKSYQMRIFCTH